MIALYGNGTPIICPASLRLFTNLPFHFPRYKPPTLPDRTSIAEKQYPYSYLIAPDAVDCAHRSQQRATTLVGQAQLIPELQFATTTNSKGPNFSQPRSQPWPARLRSRSRARPRLRSVSVASYLFRVWRRPVLMLFFFLVGRAAQDQVHRAHHSSNTRWRSRRRRNLQSATEPTARLNMDCSIQESDYGPPDDQGRVAGRYTSIPGETQEHPGRERVLGRSVASTMGRNWELTAATAQTQGRNIRHYSNYLSERARAFKDTRIDWVRAKESRLEKLSVEKGLLRETEAIQNQLTALLKCDVGLQGPFPQKAES
jgi:hypothetical protein